MGEEEKERLAVLEFEVKSVASDMTDIKATMKDIADALKILTSLNERHDNIAESLKRAFGAIERQGVLIDKLAEKVERQLERIVSIEKSIPENLSKRLALIEMALPTIKLSSSWVFKAIIGLVSLQSIGLVVAVIMFLAKK